jgi:hypothetical protein
LRSHFNNSDTRVGKTIHWLNTQSSLMATKGAKSTAACVAPATREKRPSNYNRRPRPYGVLGVVAVPESSRQAVRPRCIVMRSLLQVRVTVKEPDPRIRTSLYYTFSLRMRYRRSGSNRHDAFAPPDFESWPVGLSLFSVVGEFAYLSRIYAIGVVHCLPLFVAGWCRWATYEVFR